MEKKKAGRRRPLTTIKKIERALGRIPMALVMCVVLCAGFFVAKKIARPVLLYARDKQEISQMERELKQVQIENGHLVRKNIYLKTPEGAQTEARKLGYVRPGETPYAIQHPAKPKEQR